MTTTKKILIIIFWLAFFGFFLYKYIPNALNYTTKGFPPYSGATWLNNRLWFALHIGAGLFVYAIGIIKFTAAIRNRYIKLHLLLGKIYIIASLICILTLSFMIPDGMCEPCKISHIMITSLWLAFVLLAWYFIRQKKIEQHQRMMVRSFICAAYFVTVRIVDMYAMGIFHYLFPNESTALLASDVFVWFMPLLVFQIIWTVRDIKTKPYVQEVNFNRNI